MTSVKYRNSNGPGRAAVLLGFAKSRSRLLLWLLAIGGLALVARVVWNEVREHVAARDDYRLDPREIEITPPPPWIRADVKAEALKNASIDGPLSILDEGLVERIHQAFALHPWVAQVARVTKRHPAHVEVELIYRRPVAMVEVPGGLFPVDVEGFLLPSDDFSPLEARTYPRIRGVESSPQGSVGRPWGDPIVTGAARIAEALQPMWSELGLRSIQWVKPAAASDPSAPAAFELLTAAGNAIPWGAAPGSEPTGEPTAEQKLARLKSYVARHGSLDDPSGGPHDLDLRTPTSTPRTASRP